MLPSDVGRLVEVGDPRLAPDGKTVAFVMMTVDLEANAYRSAVWLAATDGSSRSMAVTAGQDRDGKPRWSPDGRQLAFTSHRGESGSELYLLPVAVGGEARRLWSWPEEIEELAWSPDGTRLALAARVRGEEAYKSDKDADRPPRRITRLSYRFDGVGWTTDRPQHLFVVDVTTNQTTQLTDGEFHDTGAAWSPDGTEVAFSSGRTDTWDTDRRTDIYVVPADASTPPRALTSCGQGHDRPSWAPDGRTVAFIHEGRPHDLPRHGQVGVVDVSAAEERDLTVDLDRNCASYLSGAREPVWEDDGSLLFQLDDHGDTPLYRVNVDDGATEVVEHHDGWVTGFDAVARTIAATVSTPTGFTQLTAQGRLLTALKVPFPVATPERFEAKSSDGEMVEAWLVRPVKDMDEGAAEHPAPTLLNIHGGPFSQYGNKLFDEFQVQAAAGYAVLYSNPRGSSGYSEGWGRAIRSPKAPEDPGTGWGGIDMDDVMAVVDEAVRRYPDVIDPDHLGVLGGSYGGFLTSWIVGHTDRFKAACSERAVNNLLTMSHTSDIGTWFQAGYLGVTHLEDAVEFLRQSPISYAEQINTPLLILHSEEDWRCPIEQGEDLFVRLKLLGKEVEFVRFPGEGHELSRSGSPRHRIQRFEIILDFFSRHLRH